MKKYLALLLMIIMAVSIIGCGGNTAQEPEQATEPEPSIGDQMYEKYKTIIDKLEGENYDGAIEDIQAMKPAPTIQEVEITKDNFYDYYDIVYEEDGIERDSDGKIVAIDKSDRYFSFKLKDEYSLDDNEDNTIAIGVTCGYDLKKIENVDFETGKITLADDNINEQMDEILEIAKDWIDDPSTSLSVTCEGSWEIPCYNAPGITGSRWFEDEQGWDATYDEITPNDHEGYVFVPADIQITRAEGTLHIVNK